MGLRRLALPLLALVGLAGLWTGVADSVGSGAPTPVSQAAGAQAGTGVPEATDAARRKKRRRPGCSRFCRQAGGFGAGPEPPVIPVKISRQRVRVSRDAIIAVRAKCQLTRTCIGAILVDSANASYGRADLRIPAGATRRVRLYVPARARRYLRRRGRDRGGFATVPLIYEDEPVSVSSKLTILPPR